MSYEYICVCVCVCLCVCVFDNEDAGHDTPERMLIGASGRSGRTASAERSGRNP